MRFNIILAVTLLSSIVSSLAASSWLSEREAALVKARRDLLELNEDIVELVTRRGKSNQRNYVVPGGGGNPTKKYTGKDVKNAVKDANKEHQRLQAANSNRQNKKSLLQPFGNNNHFAPKQGPARVIMQPGKSGKLELKGVVAHDQSRKKGDKGHNDHFQVKSQAKKNGGGKRK
ncbi:hypothetical protein BKA70DRAFT_1429083 [Coprinopsis sp. MPI-PUGE-AT-0042]|nr:hypothetical protein BKA70DRAFT_1429083 [Coprinopsis sp. MPI-PUGE-AT-0042]